MAVLLALVLWRPASGFGVYDEPFYIRYAELIDRVGISKAFLNHLPGSPGPLVALVQYAFKPLTKFGMPGMRLVNSFLLALVVMILWEIYRLRGAKNPLASSLASLAIPATWIMSGLAMSEMPAVLFVTLSLLFITRWLLVGDDETTRIWLYAFAGGLCLGVGALGRQTFLALMGAPILYAIFYRKQVVAVAIFCAAAMVPVLPVFLVWGDIMPPSPLRVHSGLSPVHAILSFGYMGLFFLILAPRWFYRKVIPVAAIFLATLAINSVGGFLQIAPTALAQHRLSGFWLASYKNVVSSALLALGIVFLVSLAVRVSERRNDPQFVFLTAGLFLLGLVPIMVSNNYSNRYTACALPLIILVSGDYGPETRAKALRMIVGIGLGVFYLVSYLFFSPGWELPWSSVIQ